MLTWPLGVALLVTGLVARRSARPPHRASGWRPDAGLGARQVTWAASEGRWTVVVMNQDGSRPVAADIAAGVTAPMLRGLWTALYATAALFSWFPVCSWWCWPCPATARAASR